MAKTTKGNPLMMIRTGIGQDSHRFLPPDSSKPCILGGIIFQDAPGFIANSDGDVVIHAVCDALLGAAGLSDIGTQFPDGDARYKDIDSRKLLYEVRQLLRDRGWHVVNVDATIIAQAPRMAPHIPAMRARLAADLGVDPESVNVKAKTTEKLGFVGRGEGIAAEAVALLVENKRR